MSEKTYLSQEDILSIPDYLCPMFVLSDNVRSLVSWGIKVHEKGSYNHAMWLMPGHKFASQNYIFQLQDAKDYLGKFRLKLWYNPLWTGDQQTDIIIAILNDLEKPWYKRLYDPIAILGQALCVDSLQVPGLDICSDKGSYLKLVDKSYDLKHPDPEEVNRWLEAQGGKYQVYGRYVPD